ncbi:MAG: NYN domain-containing protein, partial [Pyrinomonadaceae bacterium]
MNPSNDEVTLVAGDGDYVPTIEKLRKRGFEFHVVFWEHASRELKAAASKFVSLNPYLDFLRVK